MFLGGMIPIATYSVPAMCGLLILVVLIEFDRRTAWTCYGSVCFLSLILVINKEAVLMYIFLFGQYPIIKTIIEKQTNTTLNYFIKFLYFNFTVIVSYYIAINILGLGELTQAFEDIAIIGYISLLVLGNISFLLYDFTLTVLVPYYFMRIRSLIK